MPMNRIIILALFALFAASAQAQNKSLGVGTATPNPNAALHVESPTGNQGAIMPRLSTAQRTAMAGILGAADAGMLLYDNDLKGLYIWNGTAWESSAKIRYPQVDTVTSIPPNGNALRIVYNSTDVGNFGVAHFENRNPNSGFSAIFGRTNSATNGAADFMVSNPANTNDAVGATTNALNGRAGAFSLNNAGSRNHALFAQSNGDSTGSAIHGNNIGNGFGVFGKSAGTKFASAAVYGEHVGTGDAAGAFRINNPANTYAALYGETNGSGSALFANNLGTGRAGQIQINNPTNASAALRAFTNGRGNAGFFTINNVTNDSSALYITTNGTGNAITANAPIQATQFIGDGSLLTNVGSGGFILPRVDSITTATGTTDLFALKYNNAENKRILRVENLSTTNGSSAVSIQNNGTGIGIFSRVNNAAAGSTAIYGTTNSNLGGAVAPVGVYGESTGTGSLAASFRVNNAGNTFPAVFAETNGSGPTIRARNIGSTNGFAGLFSNDSTGNLFPAIQASTRGQAPGVRVLQNSTSFGSGVDVILQNPSGNGFGVSVNQQGIASAGEFTINNGSSNANAINATTNGTGNAMSAVNSGTGFGLYARALGATDAIYATKQAGDGTGSAGNFDNQESGNNASTLFAMTNASGGSAIGAINSANGNAFTIFQGGMRVSTHVLTGGGDINVRAVAYTVDADVYAFTIPLNEGDIFYFYNIGASNATVESFTIVPDEMLQLIYLGGVLRRF